MKNLILGLALIAFVGVSTTSCKSEKKELVKVEYYCPMKCEEGKTYEDKDMKCPVCGMDLVVKEKHEDDHGGNHEH